MYIEPESLCPLPTMMNISPQALPTGLYRLPPAGG